MAPALDDIRRLTRRGLLRGAATASLAGLAGRAAATNERDDRTEGFVMTARAVGGGDYLYLPFDVPEGVTRIDAELSTSGRENTSVGVGLFDHRGPGYQSDGFRGVYGAERSSFYVTATDASQSFLPGPIEAGTWTVVVPVFRAPAPTTIAVRVTLTYGGESHVRRSHGRRPPPTVSRRSRWYGGDLHAHTPASSDAWATGTALSPAEWAARADEIGLDFVSLTDHNVVTQNLDLGTAMRAADGDVLLIGGEEMTNWFHGHATVTGLAPGEWLDFRQRPTGVPRRQYEARIERFFATTRRLGAYTAAAHPLLAVGNNQWQFFHDGQLDPAARPDGIEVWNGPWTPDDEAAVRLWDRLLQQGWRLTASGGSDTHGTDDPTYGQRPGVPTTRVYAEELSSAGIVDGLHRGRAYITHAPDGPELLLSAAAAGDTATMGGTVTARPADRVTVEATVRGGRGLELLVIRDGAPVTVRPITADEATVTTTQVMGHGGFVRLELRGEPSLRTEAPRTSRGGMKALTNPVYLESDPPA